MENSGPIQEHTPVSWKVRLVCTVVFLFVAFVFWPWYTFWMSGPVKETLDNIYKAGMCLLLLSVLLFFMSEMRSSKD